MEENKNSKSIIFSIVAVLLLVVVVAGATYAYFASSSSTAKQEIKTGSLAMGFTNGEFLRADSLMPISDSEIKTKAAELDFSVTNQGTEHMNLTISLTDIEISDDLKDVDFRWGLYNKDKDLGIAFGIFKDIGTNTSVTLLTDTIIDAVLDENEEDITKNYTLRVWIHDDGANQNYMQGETFSAKVTVDGEPVKYTPEECFDFDLTTGTITGYDTDWQGTTCRTDKVDGVDELAVVIPKTIDGVTVTKIGENVMNFVEGNPYVDFYNYSINKVILPDTITQIGDGAISYNVLNHLTIPDSVTDIGSMYAVAIDVTIPESVTSGSFSATFYGDEIVESDTLVIPGSMATIVESAFGESRFEKIILMEGITTIEKIAFSGAYGITSIEIPSTVTTIGEKAFVDGNDYGKDMTQIIVRGKTSIPSTFDENWNCKNDGCTERYNVVFRP